MNFEKYTDRSRGFVQSAQSLAQREGHQQFAPEHLLKVLLDDPEGLAAGLIDRAGGNSRAALAATSRRRSPSGRRFPAAAPARSISIRPWRACSTPPRRPARRPATVSSPSSGCCSRSRSRRTARPGKILANAGVTPQTLNAAIEALRKGRTADTASAENAYDALKKYARDLTQAARDGKLDPVIGRDEEIRRTIQVLSRRTKNNPVLIGEPGVGKTAIVEGLGAAHRQRRRAGEPAGQEALGARHGRLDRRRQISRRVRGAAQSRAAGSHRLGRRLRAVHRRDAHHHRRRQGRRRDGCVEPAQAGAGARRIALHRRHHARRIQEARREGRRLGAALPAGLCRRADASRTRSRSCAA